MRYVWFLVILCIFCLTLFFSEREVKWRCEIEFIISGMSILLFQRKESYVRTTNDSNQTVVLSEAQSYGMLITVAAAEKDKPNKQTLTDSITII